MPVSWRDRLFRGDAYMKPHCFFRVRWLLCVWFRVGFQLSTLNEFGFERDHCHAALLATEFNVENASNWLLENRCGQFTGVC